MKVNIVGGGLKERKRFSEEKRTLRRGRKMLDTLDFWMFFRKQIFDSLFIV
jgi:hypothetical protein